VARQITDAQKAAAVQRVKSGESKAAVARSLGVSGPTVTNWINAAAAEQAEAAPKSEASRFAPPAPAEVVPPPAPAPKPVVPGDVAPPATLAPIPGPQQAPTPTVVAAPPAPVPTIATRDEVCGMCRPPQGVHPCATSFTCAHGHWVLHL
jgi:hypothetical protein